MINRLFFFIFSTKLPCALVRICFLLNQSCGREFYLFRYFLKCKFKIISLDEIDRIKKMSIPHPFQLPYSLFLIRYSLFLIRSFFFFTSIFGLRSSIFGLPTSNFQLPTSHFQLPTYSSYQCLLLSTAFFQSLIIFLI